MNKFITKVAKLFLGLATAAGVGVAVSGGHKETKTVLAATESDSLTLSGVSGTSGDIKKGSTTVATFSAPDRTTSGQQWRIAQNKTMTFSVASGYVVNSVTFKTNSTTSYMPNGTYTVDGVDKGSKSFDSTTGTISNLNVAESLVFTQTNSNGARITVVSVTYSESGAAEDITSYTDIIEGDYKIVFRLNGSTTDYYMTTSYDGNKRFSSSTTASEAGVFTFTSTGSSNGWYLSFDDSGTTKYIKPHDSQNGYNVLNTSTTDMGLTAQAGTNGNIRIGTGSRYIQRNGTASTNVIGSYTGTQRDIYKLIPVQTYTVSFAVNTAGYGTVSQSSITGVPSGTSISTSNNTVTINGTTVTATPTANTAQYTYAFSSWSNASGTVTTARTITANFTRTTNMFTVGGTIDNGSLSSTASVAYGSALNITINPNSGYLLPDTLTSVTMGGPAYAGYTYNNSTGAFSIASVTGNVVINATCPLDGVTHNISGTITNGTLTGDTGEQVEGDDYVVQISPSTYYKYPTSISVTGAGEEGSGWEYNSSDGIVYIYGLGGNVTISATCPAASITSITVSGQKTAFTLGEDFSFGGTVKASYDDVAGSTNVTISTDLVNIDSSAYDAFTESNSYTISVALKSNGSVSTSYTVSVTRKSISTTTTYVKVSASQSDWSGKYVILSSDNAYVMGTTIDSNRVTNGTLSDLKNSSGSTISSEDTVIASGYTNYVYTIAKSGNYYTISPDTGTNAGKYLAGKSSKNQADFISDGTDDLAKWTITYSSGFVFENLGRASQTDTPANRYLRSNTTSGFACYSSSQSKAPHLFAKTDTPSGTKSLIRITAVGPADNEKKEDDILTAADFTVTALYDTAESGTVTQNVSVTSGATLVAGSNTVTLSYTEGGVTKTCQVTVVAAVNTASLDGIVWSQEGVSRTIFEGSAIGSFGTLEKHYDDESTIALNLNECTVAVYNNTSGSKAHDVADPSTYTWNITNDNGKYLGVTYDEYTLYSGVVNVVETINAVYGKVEQMTFTTKASATNPIAVGDTVVFAYDDASMEMVDNTGSLGEAGSFTTNPAGTYALTVEEGSEEGSFAFKNGTDYVAYTKDAGTTSNNNLHKVSEVNDTSSWTVSYDGDVVSLVNVHNTEREIHYNTSSGQERFCAYLSTNSFPCIQVYKGVTAWVPSGSNIANTNAVVQKAVLEYSVHFNETMACVNAGTTSNVSGKWSSLSDDFDDLLAEFESNPTDLAHCKALFAGADAVEGGDTLQDMLARYEFICGKYKTLTDFLAAEGIGRPPVARSATISPLSLIGLNDNNANTVAIIVIISMVSVTAIGGYFFLRKRKENI